MKRKGKKEDVLYGAKEIMREALKCSGMTQKALAVRLGIL